MNTIYLLSDKSTAEMNHGRMYLKDDDGMSRDIPLEDVGCVVLNWHAHISMPLVFTLLEKGTPLFFVNEKGESVASMGGEAIRSESLFVQHNKFDDDFSGIEFAADVVCGKLNRQQYLLEEYVERKESEVLRETAEELSLWSKCIWGAEDMELIRKCESIATRHYYRAFAEIFDQNLWPWKGRVERQAHDPVNALLNLGYDFLEREVRIAVLGSCLRPSVGFFHTNNDGIRNNLVLDLMELFRAPVADRFVLQLLDRGTLSPENFVDDEKTGCRLTEEAFSVWQTAYEEYMAKSELKDCDGKTPRELIRTEVREFAEGLLKAQRTPPTHG